MRRLPLTERDLPGDTAVAGTGLGAAWRLSPACCVLGALAGVCVASLCFPAALGELSWQHLCFPAPAQEGPLVVTAPGTGSGGACTGHSGPEGPALTRATHASDTWMWGVGVITHVLSVAIMHVLPQELGLRGTWPASLPASPCPRQACRLLAQSQERSPDVASGGLFSRKQVPTGTHLPALPWPRDWSGSALSCPPALLSGRWPGASRRGLALGSSPYLGRSPSGQADRGTKPPSKASLGPDC